MSNRHLLSLENVSREELRSVLELAREVAAGSFERPLSGKTVFLAFFEPSTRTAASFELAARRAGADVISISTRGSSLEKGESLVDTVVTLDRLGADVLVVRHGAAGAAALAARHTGAAVINAGDGRGQHPTQALLDLYALSAALGGFGGLAGRKAAIIGDILHSRVARSVIPAFRAAGMEVALVAPPTLLPQEPVWEAAVLESVDAALEWGAEVLYTLRLQRERMAGALIPSVQEYAARYGVQRRHLLPGVRVMHPGPVNRGVEIAGDVVLDEASLIPDQVAAGIHVRAAVLMQALGVGLEVAA
ncbi:aspartate carbamoyltransferase catalytic subunit [Rubrobacter taiwanensis]|uniref:Aspartate carbamoyltransferase n=1 Tax=Rubrobacter taiwanensis TaxID=185139 RepID=A0A4R1BJ27_9ACTN|nr:aspartate carbamoyltransferase catalytic subunit [Rubrobacter taiwanensis]TCJ17289.1 aspartate carbamoyltransferase catalytic subunit [Rubrobacter taiwanensis]